MQSKEQFRRLQHSNRMVLFSVYFSLFLDNMFLAAVVPIVPGILFQLDLKNSEFGNVPVLSGNANCSDDRVRCQNMSLRKPVPQSVIQENEEIGLLLASKAIVQLLVNPFIGPLTNRIGCSIPLFVGTVILILSCFLFAYGQTFAIMFLARSIQGVGSACISVAGMAMIADKYPDDKDRCKIMGIIMGGIAAGVLVGYPFGSVMYDFAGKTTTLLVVTSLLCLDSVILLIFLRPHLESEKLLIGTSITKLLCDPYILLASGAICVSTFAIAILEPCLPLWVIEYMSPPRWQLGLIFIPDSVGYLIGTHCFGSIAFRFGRWCTAMVSLFVVGVCSVMIPLSTHIIELVVPHFGVGLGIGVIDASLMPLLAFLVDSRYVALYGSVYAIAQAAVCTAYFVGPLLGGYLVKIIGFQGVMRAVGILNLIYCPLCYFLRNTTDTEANRVIMR